MKFVAAGMNPMDLKRGIDKAVAAAIEELQDQQADDDHKDNRPSRRHLRQLRR